MLCVSLLSIHELSHLTVGVSHIVFVAIAVYYRQQLREKFGLRSGSADTLAQDCFVWWCCCCCAAAQEARQVERVALPGTATLARGPQPREGPVPALDGRGPPSQGNAAQLQTANSFSTYSEGLDSPRSNIGLLKAQE